MLSPTASLCCFAFPAMFLGVFPVFSAEDLSSPSFLCLPLPGRDGGGAPRLRAPSLGWAALFISPPKVPCQGCAPRPYFRCCVWARPAPPRCGLSALRHGRALQRGCWHAGEQRQLPAQALRWRSGTAVQVSRAGAALWSEPRPQHTSPPRTCVAPTFPRLCLVTGKQFAV